MSVYQEVEEIIRNSTLKIENGVSEITGSFLMIMSVCSQVLVSSENFWEEGYVANEKVK